MVAIVTRRTHYCGIFFFAVPKPTEYLPLSALRIRLQILKLVKIYLKRNLNEKETSLYRNILSSREYRKKSNYILCYERRVIM
jgi:hypothetical protein